MAWWLWVVMGVVLLVVEMATPGGLFAIFFGIGAFLIAPVAALGAPPWVQWMLYTAASLVMLATLRGVLAQRLKARGSGPVDSLVGESATLLDDLAPGGEAKAELRGTQWNARSTSAVAIPRGRRCHVERVEGLTLWLRAE
jgi:membrane protein implicated in regulation of membrane protease activity